MGDFCIDIKDYIQDELRELNLLRTSLLQQTSIDLNYFQLFRTSKYEDIISQIIQFFLISDNHHQGNEFLKLFIIDIARINIEPDLTNIDIETNKTNKQYTGNQDLSVDDLLKDAKVDLTIHLENMVIFLEHKINATDSEKQLEKYFKLGEEIKNGRLFIMLYLHPTRNKVKDEHTYGDSTSKIQEVLTFVNYKNIYDWMIKCREISNSERLRMFIDAFLNYLREIGNIKEDEISEKDPYYQLVQLDKIERRLFNQISISTLRNDFSQFRDGVITKTDRSIVLRWYFNQFRVLFQALENKIGNLENYDIVNQFSLAEYYYYPKFMLIPHGKKYTLQIEINENFENHKKVKNIVPIKIGFGIDNAWLETNGSEAEQLRRHIREQLKDNLEIKPSQSIYWVFFLKLPEELNWMNDICSVDGMSKSSQKIEVFESLIKQLIEIDNKCIDIKKTNQQK